MNNERSIFVPIQWHLTAFTASVIVRYANRFTGCISGAGDHKNVHKT